MARVKDVRAPLKGLSVHKVTASAALKIGEELTCRVDASLRSSTIRNHTATHLLHAALRKTLGTHVKQAGSVVDPSRLRFDVTHYATIDSANSKTSKELLTNTSFSTPPSRLT